MELQRGNVAVHVLGQKGPVRAGEGEDVVHVATEVLVVHCGVVVIVGEVALATRARPVCDVPPRGVLLAEVAGGGERGAVEQELGFDRVAPAFRAAADVEDERAVALLVVLGVREGVVDLDAVVLAMHVPHVYEQAGGEEAGQARGGGGAQRPAVREVQRIQGLGRKRQHPRALAPLDGKARVREAIDPVAVHELLVVAAHPAVVEVGDRGARRDGVAAQVADGHAAPLGVEVGHVRLEVGPVAAELAADAADHLPAERLVLLLRQSASSEKMVPR